MCILRGARVARRRIPCPPAAQARVDKVPQGQDPPRQRKNRTKNEIGVIFFIMANAAIWRAVFNREIDPFVATTQKKMNLRGDFARISKWYAPCSRIFQLWSQVPVE